MPDINRVRNTLRVSYNIGPLEVAKELDIRYEIKPYARRNLIVSFGSTRFIQVPALEVQYSIKNLVGQGIEIGFN